MIFALLSVTVVNMLAPNAKRAGTIKIITGAFVLCVLIAPLKNGIKLPEIGRGFSDVRMEDAYIQNSLDDAVLENAEQIISRRVDEIAAGYGIKNPQNNVYMDNFEKSNIVIKQIEIFGTDIDYGSLGGINADLKAEFGEQLELIIKEI